MLATGSTDGFSPPAPFVTCSASREGTTGADDSFASNWNLRIGAEIMGRNTFGPQRGVWADEGWRGKLERRFEIEVVNSPSGVTHLAFSRR